MSDHPPWPGDDEGFAIVPGPERGQPPTPGQDLDFRLALDEQTFDALSDKIGQLEARVMVLEDVATVLQVLVLGVAGPGSVNV